jgi:hypothetical protein
MFARTALALLAIVLSVGSLAAQFRPVRLGIAAGVSIESVPGREDLETGGHAQLSLRLKPPVLPASLRLDALYFRFGVRDAPTDCVPTPPVPCPDVRSRNEAIAGIASITIESPGPGLSPYLIGGAGVYWRRLRVTTYNLPCTDACQPEQPREQTETEWTNDFGINGGLGLSFNALPLGFYVEARVHHIFLEGKNATVVPLTAGIWF